MSYLDLEGFKGLTLMPSSYVDELELAEPGWITTQLAYWSSWIDARLAKRYAAPFSSPYPVAVTGWLARLVTLRAMLRRGLDANDAQFETYQGDHDSAKTEVEEAANSETGLFELPLRADTSASGITRGGPLGYSEASPYVWMDGQRETGVSEDMHGSGTGG